MQSSFSEKLKDKKVAYAALLMAVGILLHYFIEEFKLFDEELLGFFTGFFFGGSIVLLLSVFVKKNKS